MELTFWKKFGLSSNALKLFALVAMTIDHLGYFVFPRLRLLRIIGRLAFPVFAYCIAEGCFYTKHPWRYFLSVFAVGAVSHLVTYITEGGSWEMNAMLTFSFSIFTIFGMRFFIRARRDKKRGKCALGVLWTISSIALAWLVGSYASPLDKFGVHLDYGFVGAMIPVALFPFRKKFSKLLVLAGMLCLLAVSMEWSVQWYGLLALIPIALYNGTRGKWNIKYLFYLYYPLHVIPIYYLAEFL